jgi:predicted dehydrogenase
MTNRKLQIGVVGCGGEAMLYIQDYLLTDKAEVRIVQDIDARKAEECARKFGIPNWTTDAAKVLASEVDIVDVSTPNHLHASQSIAALEAGKHVLVQKPMAPTVAECEQMIAAARKNGQQLGVYMSALNDPLNHEIKRMVERGFFGAISSARTRGAHLGGLHMKPKNLQWRSSVAKTGGGSFIQLAIHGIHLLEWILQSDIVRVAAFSKNLICKEQLEGDDITTALGELHNGIHVTIESSYCALGGMLEIYGTEGYLIRHGDKITIYSVNHFAGEILAHPGQKLEIEISTSQLKEKTQRLEAKYNQHQAFLHSVAEDGELPTPGEIGLRGVKIVKAVYEAAETGKTVNIA